MRLVLRRRAGACNGAGPDRIPTAAHRRCAAATRARGRCDKQRMATARSRRTWARVWCRVRDLQRHLRDAVLVLWPFRTGLRLLESGKSISLPATFTDNRNRRETAFPRVRWIYLLAPRLQPVVSEVLRASFFTILCGPDFKQPGLGFDKAAYRTSAAAADGTELAAFVAISPSRTFPPRLAHLDVRLQTPHADQREEPRDLHRRALVHV